MTVFINETVLFDNDELNREAKEFFCAARKMNCSLYIYSEQPVTRSRSILAYGVNISVISKKDISLKAECRENLVVGNKISDKSLADSINAFCCIIEPESKKHINDSLNYINNLKEITDFM